MKKFKTIGISLLVAACAACLSLAFVACKGGEKSASYGAGEEGFYYYDGADSARYMLSLQSGTYMITAGNETSYSGSYSYDEESGEISFDDGNFSAKMGESALSLDISDSGYSFKAYKYFDVTYVDESGKVVATESVLNGQSASEIDAEKDGYWFIGWYEDSSNSSEFAFNTSIAGDTTVYGWYIEKNLTVSEYEITLDYGDGTTETVSTMNGALWTFPTDGILGWWVSATNKSDELTHKYNAGDVFTSDTTLYAVYSGMGASVTSSGITWENATGANVSVTVYNEDGTVAVALSSTSSSNASFAPMGFSSLSAGTYTVEVTSGSTTEYLTYIVNGLARVSTSSAEVITNGNGEVFSFAPVDGAAGYVITVSDGTRTLTEDLGPRTYYNFSGWDMTKDGLTFTVTAYAEGYVSSVSDEYCYLLVLDKVTVGVNGENVVWNRAEGALEYEVIIYGEDGNVLDTVRTSDNSYSLKYYDAGTYTISVRPVTDGYYSEASTYYGYAKSTIAAPVITDITSYSVTWGAVTGATSYVVSVNGAEYKVEEGTTLVFTDTNMPATADIYEISVKAVGTNGNDSSYSDAVTTTNGGFTSGATYYKNTVTWNYDLAAAKYVISVNGDKTYTVTSGNSQEIELTKAGTNEITVTAYDAEDEAVGYVGISVYAYSVTIDGNGAETEKDVVYVAQGDTLNLGTASLDHADFLGWYTQADYSMGQSDEYEGNGTEILDGSTFTGNRSTYIYAYYSYEWVDVRLVSNMGSMTDENGNEVESVTVKIKYNSTSFELPTPSPYDGAENFAGWNTVLDGSGTSYTGQSGLSNGTAFAGETTLYAYYLSVLYYERTTYNGETVYSVSAGSEIEGVEDVTIPETYNGCSLILNSNAFYGCTDLEVLNIPDTVLYISIANNGYDSGTGAFAGCSSLEKVNIVYDEDEEADSQKEILYYSVDGVLFKKTSDTEVQLVYYPQGKIDETYTMPSSVSDPTECDAFGNSIVYGVTSLPGRVFKDKAFTSVVISSSVTEIASYAFYGNSNLTSITFEDGGSKAISIAERAFYNCTALQSITLPSRLTEFDPYMFSGCTSLTAVYAAADSESFASGENGALLSKDMMTLVYYPIGLSGEVTIANLSTQTITVIGADAFAANTKITGVTLPDGLTTIGASAFEGCTGLTEISIPASVTMIGESAFSGCTKIETLEFKGDANSGKLTISSKAFYGCSSLTSVTLPQNLVGLGANAFGECTRLTYVYFNSYYGATKDDLDFESNAFGSSSYVATLEFGEYVPDIDFASIFGSSRLEQIIIDSNNVNFMSDDAGAVYNHDGTEIMYYPLGKYGAYTLLNTTTTISSTVFADRTNLTEITIPASVTSIAVNATNGNCTAFSGCTYLTAINVESGNTVYTSKDGVLYQYNEDGTTLTLLYCPVRCSVTSLTVDSSVTAVQCYAFQSNASVTDVSFAACTTLSLGTYTFYNATALTTVTFPSCVTAIPDYAFSGCSALLGDLSVGGTMTIPEGITTIGQRAFYNCKNFAATIPSTVESIGAYAFYYCWDSSIAQAPITFASVGKEDAPDLTIDTYAFYYCAYATSLTIPKNIVSVGTYGFYYFGYSISSGTDTPLTFEDGCQITEFSNYMFYYARRVQSIEIPSTVTRLGQYSMGYMQGLTSLEIPASVVTIDTYAFYNVQKLETFTFAEGSQLETIGNYAFQAAFQVTSVETVITIPASVTSLGTGTGRNFYNCYGIDKVIFEEGSQITSLPPYCFWNCYSIKEIVFPSSLEEIGNYAFENCTGITSIEIPASVTTIGNSAYSGCYNVTEITFEEGSNIASIGENAFGGCIQITSFAFPETTADELVIGNDVLGAYYYEDNDRNMTVYGYHLDYLYISSKVKNNIGNTLVNCMEIKEFEVSADNPSYKTDAEGKVLYDISGGTIVYVCSRVKTLEIDSSVKVIGDSAFGNQTELTSITIPASVTSIGSSVFYACTSLVSVTFASGCTITDDNFGTSVFSGCTSLTTVNLPAGLTKIPNSTFYGCSSLMRFDIPSGVTSIGQYAFQDTGLETIDLSGVTYLDAFALSYCRSLVSVTSIESSVAFGGNAVFGYCDSLKDITLPEGITQITNYMFEYDYALEYIKIPSTVTSIGTSAFTQCTSLEEVVLPAGLTSLPDSAFNGCKKLTECAVPTSCTSFGSSVFNNTAIKSIIIPTGCTTIPTSMFANDTALVSVTIPDTVTTISNTAFNGCSSLETVIMSANVTSLGNQVFYNCTSLVEVQFGPYLETFGTQVFQGCTSLERIDFGSYMKTIGNNSFNGCTSLEEVTFEKGIETLGTNVFYNCTSLEYVFIPSTVSSIGADSFYNCTCVIYVDNTKNYVGTNWASGWVSSTADNALAKVYYYSDDEPVFNEDGTDYDGGYWHYDENYEMTEWVFPYTTYAVAGGGYVLCTDADSIAYVCLYDADTETSTVYAVSVCTESDGSYSVTLENGDSYTVVLDETAMTVTITSLA